jgi:hypothetical protein
MIKFYYYQHPQSKDIFSDQRFEEFKDKPYISPDGQKCLRIDYTPPKEDKDIGILIIDKNAEFFQRDPEYVKACKPEYVRFKDGHREKYDPTKHY